MTPESKLEFHSTAETVPVIPGAYALLLRLTAELGITLPGKTGGVLPPGRYLYCGSARGPGGLRARVGRHMRRDKPIRWHIDHLTKPGCPISGPSANRVPAMRRRVARSALRLLV